MYEKIFALKRLGLLVALAGVIKVFLAACGVHISNELTDAGVNLAGVVIAVWGVFTNHFEDVAGDNEEKPKE